MLGKYDSLLSDGRFIYCLLGHFLDLFESKWLYEYIIFVFYIQYKKDQIK